MFLPMQTKLYATKRAEARAVKYPGETGAKRLATKLGCGHVSVYEWERVGAEHLPKNPRIRADYLRAIGLTESAPVRPLAAIVTRSPARRAHAPQRMTRGGK